MFSSSKLHPNFILSYFILCTELSGLYLRDENSLHRMKQAVRLVLINERKIYTPLYIYVNNSLNFCGIAQCRSKEHCEQKNASFMFGLIKRFQLCFWKKHFTKNFHI